MGRNKKKQKSSEEKVNILNPDSDEDVPDEAHDRLLQNIKQFHSKPKISPATRNEPAAEVSEFHLSKEGKKRVREKDLLRAIKRKQPKVARKLESIKKPKTLPKPLENIQERKIQREIGFENVQQQLNRWDDVVTSNRLADQLRFPLRNDKIEIYDHSENNLFSNLPNPTPLEKELTKVLNSSDIAKKHEAKLEKSKFRLTLREMIEKRKLIAKFRARASYKIAKAWRQNKIKSKKYHRILRREKTKQQMKDFEVLQKTDPNAALEQLKKLEKERAHERTTLRHRNTGKWAKNQIVKATYNKESRVALSEQLSKNRELTQKTQVELTDSESEEENLLPANFKADPNNPWTATDGDDYNEFVANYKQFWQKKNDVKVDEKFEDDFIPQKDKSGETETVANKKRKRKNDQSSKKVKVVQEIVNSSGSWTVTKDRNQLQNVTAPVKKNQKTKAKKKRVRFAETGNVSEALINVEPVSNKTMESNKYQDVDPKAYQLINIKRTKSKFPETISGGDEGIDDDYEERMPISEAFANDDVVNEFEIEKEKAIKEAQPKEVDLSLPGWGSWTGNSISEKEQKKSKIRVANKRLLYKVPQAPPRNDANKGFVIINEEKNDKIKEHLMNDLPFPFKSVKDYETSIRAPIGRTWLPETAHQKLIAPPVVTKLGTVIEPMDEGELLSRDEN